MMVKITGDVSVTWESLILAVLRHSADAPVQSLAIYDAERLGQASSGILYRLQVVPAPTMYGVWCFKSDEEYEGGWESCSNHKGSVLAFPLKEDAEKVAAELFGFETYAAVKASGWCEVRLLISK